MAFIEAPTNFYLGRTFNNQTDKLGEDVVYYDSRDLTTHAVVVGMTGSGKTGLCVTMLEEAILDNIPAIIIDPKGDITNLALTFPEMRPEDFQPFIHQADARRAGMDIGTYAADIAQTWQDGLAQWGIVKDRIRWMKGAAELSIYTPGSDAGLPISILASLRAPRYNWQGQEEATRERITGIVNALFALAGMKYQSVKDVEHVLLSNIIETSWRAGKDLTLEDIVLQIKQPSFDKLGVFPLDQAISEKKRYKLAMELNNIIAAPSFQSWLQGQPLDIQSLLYQPNGRPKVSIFYTAHLNDQERMFITTLILESIIGWMRTLSGTPSLRAILYIDEMFGLFPPYPKNPPTKEPLLRLVKQARAFGVGMILATQNPGDLDYKGLSNAGTWFIGRLSSENDRNKVMSGLKSMATAEEGMDLGDVEQLIADVQPRVFLMRNVHNTGGPILMHTRWAMSYLAGPMTRTQIGWLMQNQKQQLMARMAQQQYVGQGYGQQAPYGGGYSQGQQGWTQPHQTGGFGLQGAPPPPPGYGAQGTPPPPPGFGAQGAPPPPPGFAPQQPNYGQGGFGQMPPQGGFGAQSTGFGTQGMPPANNNMGATQGTNAQNQRLPGDFVRSKPPITSSIQEYFLPAVLSSQQAVSAYEQRTSQRIPTQGGQMALAYKPVLLAQTAVRYQEKKAEIYTSRDYAFHIPDLEARGLVHWEDHQAPVFDVRQLSREGTDQAIFQELPMGLLDEKRIKDLEKELVDFLYNTARLIIPHHPQFKMYGHPDADIGQFQSQVYQKAREERDTEIDKLTERYGGMMDKLEDRLRKKVRELEAEQIEIRDRKREQLYTTGEAVLSLLQGRTNYTLSRMSRTTRYKRQTEEDISESQEVIVQIEQEMYELEQEYETKLTEVNNKWGQIANSMQEYTITPYKKDIHVMVFGVGWLPHYYVPMGMAGEPLVIPAIG
ncbi:MAG: helicase HerA domain-containing protein [Anaerolineae bacterium]